MSPISRYSLIVLAALSVPAGAHVRAHHNTPAVPPDARASAMPAAKMEMYPQCEEMARLRWGTNSQDMQTPRDFAYRACMYDHSMRNPWRADRHASDEAPDDRRPSGAHLYAYQND